MSLELRGVTTTYDGERASRDGSGEPAIRDVDLTVESGELLALVGPSGCGKTTLLRTVAGLETPDAGRVHVGGRDVTDRPPRERDVGLVFQDNALFPHKDVRENLGFNLQLQGAPDRAARVAETAELLGIADLLDRSLETLSGGQTQRVALGRALATEPACFLLDEPLANLDAALRDRMRTEIARLQDDLGVTTVHVTHNQAEALSMGDRVAVMRDGRIEQVGTPREVYREPATRFVATFLGSPPMNCLSGRVEDGSRGAARVRLDGGEVVTLPPAVGSPEDGATVTVGVRPEAIEVAADRSDIEGALALGGTVAHVEFAGPDTLAYVELDAGRELVARTRTVEEAAELSVGDAVTCRVPASAIHPFDDAGDRLVAGEQSGEDEQFEAGHQSGEGEQAGTADGGAEPG